MSRGQHAAQAGEIYANAEVERAEQTHVDTQRRYRLEIERARTYTNSKARVAQQHEQCVTATATIATMKSR